MKILKVAHSFSGNTLELSELIEKNLDELDSSIEIVNIQLQRKERIDLTKQSHYDIILIGTFTWGKGEVHRDMQQFFVDNISVLRNTAIAYYGTGDTQFGGEELFCNAIEILNSKAPSNYPLLKIEQSPRGSQEIKVKEWCINLLNKGVGNELKTCEKTKIIEPNNPNKSTGLFTGESSGILNWNDLLYPEMHEIRTKIRDTFYNASDFKVTIPDEVYQSFEALNDLKSVLLKLLKETQLSIDLTSRLEGYVTDPSLVSIMATMSDQMYEHIRSYYRFGGLGVVDFDVLFIEHALLDSELNPERILMLIKEIINGKEHIIELLGELNNMLTQNNEELKMTTHIKKDHVNHIKFFEKIESIANAEFSLKGMI